MRKAPDKILPILTDNVLEGALTLLSRYPMVPHAFVLWPSLPQPPTTYFVACSVLRYTRQAGRLAGRRVPRWVLDGN